MQYPNESGSYALGDLAMNDHIVVSWRLENKDLMLCLNELATINLMFVLIS